MFGWPAWLTSGFSGNPALEICSILSFVSLYVILFEPNKYLLLLQYIPLNSLLLGLMRCLATVAKKQVEHNDTGTENNQYSLKYYRAKFYPCRPITN